MNFFFQTTLDCNVELLLYNRLQPWSWNRSFSLYFPISPLNNFVSRFNSHQQVLQLSNMLLGERGEKSAVALSRQFAILVSEL